MAPLWYYRSAAGSNCDAWLGGFGISSTHSQMTLSGFKRTVVNYAEVGKTNDASATISLDKSSYTTKDSPKVNIIDKDAKCRSK